MDGTKFTTNWFRVKDRTAFLDLMRRAGHLMWAGSMRQDTDGNGELVYTFGADTTLSRWLKNQYAPDRMNASAISRQPENVSRFLLDLQKHVREDDAVVIYQADADEIVYANGTAILVTKDTVIQAHRKENIKEMLVRFMGEDWTRNNML